VFVQLLSPPYYYDDDGAVADDLRAGGCASLFCWPGSHKRSSRQKIQDSPPRAGRFKKIRDGPRNMRDDATREPEHQFAAVSETARK